ncbi:MAG TPA: sigma-70 family RNA polymerase sigma factor [Thermoanaerobaculia bacterium]|nr:sigma-70 family RNA polymerase sigma factor [Thermoanaerobaculia bacterium]
MTSVDEDDAALVGRLLAGENAAFEQLVRTTSGKLLATARRILRNDEEARDAVQGAFIRAFQSLPRFRRESRLSTWLHRILVNEALMKLRARSRGPEEESLEPLLPAFAEDGHHRREPVDWSESAETALERAETAGRVRAAIDSLPESYRNAIVLRDIEEMSIAEIAEMLHVSDNVVKVRLHRARQALRTLLEREFGGMK